VVYLPAEKADGIRTLINSSRPTGRQDCGLDTVEANERLGPLPQIAPITGRRPRSSAIWRGAAMRLITTARIAGRRLRYWP